MMKMMHDLMLHYFTFKHVLFLDKIMILLENLALAGSCILEHGSWFLAGLSHYSWLTSPYSKNQLDHHKLV